VIPAIIAMTEGHAQKYSSYNQGLDVSLFDTSVKPSDNFFRFVNGTWLDKPKYQMIGLLGVVLMNY
jgi:endothelin-converting enzyme/putative endopeptidase